MAQAPSISPASNVLLLDTNVLLIYLRAGVPYQRLEAQLNLEGGTTQGVISVVTHGEIVSLAKKLGWGQKRCDAMIELLRTKLVPIDIHHPDILAAYADIDHYSEKVAKPAHPMGQNDMWIAATAHVLGCELVTTDKDFDHLDGVKIRRRYIDQATLKPGNP